jgi:DNA-binding XRE family transcriptional regulator
MKSFSLKIKEIRNSLGYTQQQMADSLGIERPAYAQIEGGKNNISLENFLIVIKNHKVNFDWLVYDKGEMFVTDQPQIINNTDTTELHNQIAELKKDKQMLQRLIDELLKKST